MKEIQKEGQAQPMKSLVVDWFANSPFSSTGYGNQTKLFTPLIKQLGHDVSIHAFFGHDMYTAPINWGGITITGRGFHPYGLDVIAAQAKTVKADIVLTLLDAWVFDIMTMKDLRWVSWFPIDHDPIPPAVLEKVRYAFDRIVMSKFGLKQMQDNDLDSHYIPHGTDTEVFKPIPDKRGEFRKMIGLPEDAFIVGMVAANKGYPDRKAFIENLAAFRELTKKHDDAVLMLHTMTGENGGDCVNLPEYCRRIGLQLGKNVFFCDQYVYISTGFPDNYMAALYNSFDVLLSVSRGEGFGIPILESQACGTPVITGDWTSMSEITFSGWKVGKEDTTPDYTRQGSYQFIPKIGAIADRLESAYQMRGNMDYRERARKGALPYDVHKITEKYWKPTLEAIAERIGKIEALRAMVQAPVKPAGTVAVKEISA
jgi:glycosyltransferase involved in cell wall biosynthesis